MRYHPAFERLRDCFSRLPGIGRRSAERLVFGLITSRDGLPEALSAALREVCAQLRCCRSCGELTVAETDPCRLCTDPARDDTLLCVVEDPADIMRIEQAGGYRGRYHALMGRLSPMGGTGVNELRMTELLQRIEQVVLAHDEASLRALAAQYVPENAFPSQQVDATSDALTVLRFPAAASSVSAQMLGSVGA